MPVLGQGFQCNYTTDIDQDDDGLIEICDLDALNAIRYQPDGSGYRRSFNAEKISIGCPRSGCIGYELRRDLDFNEAASYRDPANQVAWTSGKGWQPIGTLSNPFTARLEGNGHTLSNLFIDSIIDYAGLFTKVGRSARINGLVLSDVNIKGSSEIGSIAGLNEGIISGIELRRGSLGSSDNILRGASNIVGGIVGTNQGAVLNSQVMLDSIVVGTIEMRCRHDRQSTDCADADKHEVVVQDGNSVGGIVGINEGHITDSYADVNLLGNAQVGGAVGINDAGSIITNTEAKGMVRGNEYSGGLVGINYGHIIGSHASGGVLGNGSHSGGLVGMNNDGSEVIDSYATVEVEGNDNTGGLVGYNRGLIANSYAGDVSIRGNTNVGGLVGWGEDGEIINTYASNSVNGVNRVGGLIGRNEGILSYSFAIGSVIGEGEDIGGLAGWHHANNARISNAYILSSYWDVETSKVLVSDGGSARTTAQLQSPIAPGLLGETFEGWQSDAWDFGTAWQYPTLKHSEGPNRGRLLSGQYTLLSDLSLANGLLLSPAFDERTFDYRVQIDDNLSEIKLKAETTDAAALNIITDNGIHLSTDSGNTATITLNPHPQATLITVARQYRVQVVRPFTVEEIIATPPAAIVKEGAQITLAVSSSEPDPSRLHYNWAQRSPMQPSLIKGLDTAQAKLNINVPLDFADKASTRIDIVLQAAVSSDGEPTVNQDIKLTVVKVNNGGSERIAAPFFKGEKFLIIPDGSQAILADADGAGDISSIHYQWQHKPPNDSTWVDIEGKHNSYDITEALLHDAQYRVRLSYTDGQGHKESVMSEILSITARQDGGDKDVINISYLEDLNEVRNNLDGHYRLTRDLDFEDDGSYRNSSNKGRWTVLDYDDPADTGWSPIGNIPEENCSDLFSRCFSGIFDGDGYIISNLQMKADSSIEYHGLFAAASDKAVIRDIGLLNMRIEGEGLIGGLVGFNRGEIARSYASGNTKLKSSSSADIQGVGGLVGINRASGTIIGSYANVEVLAVNSTSTSQAIGSQGIGGLVGINDGGQIINSYALSQISADVYAGGLVGLNSNNAVIINSYALGQILVTNYGGGLVGANHNGAMIINSYATSSVSAKFSGGGLTGINNDANIINSYATGEVGGMDGSALGGLVGWNRDGVITNSYAIGKVIGNIDNAKGLIGLAGGSSAIIASYWDIDASGKIDSAGGLGKTTEQLQAGEDQTTNDTGVYYEWDETNWDFGTPNQYPILKYTKTNESESCGASGLPQCGDLISPRLRFRHGLRELSTADGSILSPPFDAEQQKQLGFYIGTVVNDINNIRLLLTTIEPNARIDVYAGEKEARQELISNMKSGTAVDIPLKDKGLTRIAIDVKSRPEGRATTATVRYLLYLDYIYHRVIDGDSDGFIDINYLEDLDAMRYQPDGSGYKANADAAKSTLGCPDDECVGYELIGDLDFHDAASYRDAALNREKWSGAGGSWTPIGSAANSFTSTFKGNNNAIFNLKLRANGGLFGSISNAEIDGVGLLGTDIKGDDVGGIAASCAACKISNSYVIGSIEGGNSGGLLGKVVAVDGGGLVQIKNSYFIGSVAATGDSNYGGGMVAKIGSDTNISDSYVFGRVIGEMDARVGSLIGSRESGEMRITNSYISVLATQAGTPRPSFGNIGSGTIPSFSASYLDAELAKIQTAFATPKKTADLQAPTTATDIYVKWHADNWDFGTAKQYPAVRYNHANCEEACGTVLAYQGSPIESINFTEEAILWEPFSFSKYDYDLSVNVDVTTIRLQAMAFNSSATIAISKDGELVEEIASGAMSAPILLNEQSNNTIITLIVKDGDRRSYRYNFNVNKLDVAAENVDKDGDGLIEINDAEQFDAIRFELDGTAYKASEASERIYCHGGCTGYELTADIDLDGIDFSPIGDAANPFNSIFRGNGHTISNLSINRANGEYIGLFSVVGANARIENIGLLNVDIRGRDYVGGIAGASDGKIINSYAVIGSVSGIRTGGVVGINRGEIINSYANVAVQANIFGGGLVGVNEARVSNSYAGGTVQTNSGVIGGLVGFNRGSDAQITNSYGRANVKKVVSGAIGGLVGTQLGSANVSNSYYSVESASSSAGGTARTDVQLKRATPSPDTYTDWQRTHWHFGNAAQYPTLLYTEGDAANPACEMPQPQQLPKLSECKARLWAEGLTADDKEVICRSHLQKPPHALPYCGGLLAEQRLGLVQLELAKGASLFPALNPETDRYDMVVNPDAAIHTTPTTYYDTDLIIIRVGASDYSTINGQRSPPIPLHDETSVAMEVKSAASAKLRRYEIDVLLLRDIKVDAKGLMEIEYLEELNAMRHQPDGSGYRQSAKTNKITKHCPDVDGSKTCQGYKLTRDLDFNNPNNYLSGEINPMWTSGAGWSPIPNFNTLFIGNGHTISNLMINRPETDDVGLFGVIGAKARIEGAGLLNVAISGNTNIGALVGSGMNNSEIVNSYIYAGRVSGTGNVGGLVGHHLGVIVNSNTNISVSISNVSFGGGLVGISEGLIRNSYATGAVAGNATIGGLVGFQFVPRDIAIINSYAGGEVSGGIVAGGLVGQRFSSAVISNSYAIAKVSGSNIGGLVGSGIRASGVTASYWDKDASGVETSSGGISKTTVELQQPESATGIYAQWDEADWHFGSDKQYPVLKYTSATSILRSPACRAATDDAAPLPECGTVLPDQYKGLQMLRLSEQVLKLMPPFNSGIFKYTMLLKSGEDEFQMLPNAFNKNAMIDITDDKGINQPIKLVSGREGSISIANVDKIVLTISVDDVDYQIDVSRHPFIDTNDIDEDGDGLIEVRSMPGLNAMRHQPDGSGYGHQMHDGVHVKVSSGCPGHGCRGYELAADIDANHIDWQPIGYIALGRGGVGDCSHRNSRCFAAIFEGNGFTISNLSIDGCKGDALCTNKPVGSGLFAALDDSAQVKNLSLSDVDIKGYSMVGSIAGYNAGTIANSYASGVIVGDNEVGALVGYNQNNIINSYVFGDVEGNRIVGGLVGRNSVSATINNSYALASISGNTQLGGLVGINQGAINNAYASGSVEGMNAVGGLVGDNRASITNSYAMAQVIAATDGGGLVGSSKGGSATDSYWDIDASGIELSANGAPKTTAELQQPESAVGIYAGWNAADWHFGTASQYPLLKYTTAADDSVLVCDGQGQPNCGAVQSYGLANLEIAEVASLSPQFSLPHLNYRLHVEAHIKQLHLIPTALDSSSTMHIVSNNGFDEVLASGERSSPIMLGEEMTEITITVGGDRTVTYRFAVEYFSFALDRKADADGDGLIEINTLEDLDAIRYSLDGRSYRHQTRDGVYIETSSGCSNEGCRGYELVRDLDFNDIESYRARRVNTAWTTGAGWQPIGTLEEPFTALFHGNGYAILNLRVNRADTDYAGLFGVIEGNEARLRQLGLVDAEIVGGQQVGGLAGMNKGGSISQSYAIVQAKSQSAMATAGGLVGANDGRISNSYAIGIVRGLDHVGGLVAVNSGIGSIEHSYAVGRVIGLGDNPKVGGLLGAQRDSATVDNSYWDIDVSTIETSAGGTSQTTTVLQSSTPTTPIGSIYGAWSPRVWDFGNAGQYPILKRSDGTQLSNQRGRDLLQDLILSGDAKLFPAFNPLIHNYTIIAAAGQPARIQLHTTPTHASAKVDIRRRGERTCIAEHRTICESVVSRSFTLEGVDARDIIIAVQRTPTAKPVQYKLLVHYAEIEIKSKRAVVTSLVVGEGDKLSLRAQHNLELGQIYRWQQVGSESLGLNAVDTEQAELAFTVPVDIVSADDNSIAAKLKLELSAEGILYASKDLSLTINKRNNDDGSRNRFALVESDPVNNPNTYEVASMPIMDDDKGLAHFNGWQWQRCPIRPGMVCTRDTQWSNIEGAATDSYTIPDDGDYQYRVVASYIDGQGYIAEFDGGEIINYIDADDDNDGLIDIRYLEELDAIRVDPSGQSYRASTNSEPLTIGCPASGCKGYELTRDLNFDDLSSYRSYSHKVRNRWRTGEGWQPIEGFDARFKGNGFTISNLYIDRADSDNAGLFASIKVGAKIDGLGLKFVNVTAGTKVGALVGDNVGTIINSYVEGGTVIASKGGARYAGGLVGRNTGIITNSYTNVAVRSISSGKGDGAGGLVGYNFNGGKIYNSHARGEVKGACSAGGLVGITGSNTSEIWHSYAVGEVTVGYSVCGSDQQGGGLVGNNTQSKIHNSYSTGRVLFGDHSNRNGRLGGLVGRNDRGQSIASYWDTTTSELNRSAVGGGRTTAQLQSPTAPDALNPGRYTGWSEDNWDFGTATQYPALKYGEGSDSNNVACGVGELPDCNLLLPGQVPDILFLRGLAFSENVQLSPRFRPEIFSYDALVEAEALPAPITVIPHALPSVDVDVKKDGASLSKRDDGSVWFGIDAKAVVTIETSHENDTSIRGVTYRVQMNLRHPPQIDISGIPTGLVNEGDAITLNASDSFGLNNAQLNYQWSQVSGHRLLPSVATSSVLTFTVPHDFVTRDKTVSEAVIKLELSETNHLGTVSTKEIALTINKLDNGHGFGNGAVWLSSNTLSAPDISTDPDGKPIDVSYTWLVERGGAFRKIKGANKRTYTLSEDAQDARYKLSMSYTDGQGHRHQQGYELPLYSEVANVVDRDGDGLIEIDFLEELDAVRYQVDGTGYREDNRTTPTTVGCPEDKCRGYELTRDLDFNDDASYSSTSNKVMWTQGEGWLPIPALNATFEGNGFTIANLMTNRKDEDNVGLFAVIKSRDLAEIRRLGLKDVSITGQDNVGGLVGVVNGGTIITSYVSGGITGRNSVGGLVGNFDRGTIISSYMSGGKVTASAWRGGGLVGSAKGGQISDSYASCVVSANSFVGGLVGQSRAEIHNSYATGDIEAQRSTVGGLVGQSQAEIYNSYATGDIKAGGGNSKGGLVGWLNHGKVIGSYARGDVMGNNSVGGLVGEADGQVDDSLAVGTVVGNTAGGLIGAGEVRVNRSYWQVDADNPIGSHNTTSTNPNYKGFSEQALRLPAAASTMDGEPYFNWSADSWHFGTSEEYPALKYHDDTCSTATPSPNCGKLLLHQRIGLRELKLEQARLSPEFDAAHTSYTTMVNTNTSELKISAIAANPDARITIDGKLIPVENSYSVPLGNSRPTTIAIQVSAQNSVRSEEPVEYKLTIKNFLPRIVNIDAPNSVDEGESVVLHAFIEDSDGDELHYRWDVNSDRLSISEGTLNGMVTKEGTTFLSMKVPEDLLSATQDRDEIEVTLTVSDSQISVVEKVSFEVLKQDNGMMSIPAPRRRGLTYIASNPRQSDRDGMNGMPMLAYQWQREMRGLWFDIAGATEQSYTIDGVVGDRYRVLVDYVDGQGYSYQRLASDAVFATSKVVYDEVASNTNLGEISIISARILLQNFDSARTTYTAVIPEHTSSIIVTAEVEDLQNARLSIEVDGLEVLSKLAKAKQQIDIEEEGQSKEVKIIVTAGNGRTSTYTLTIFRDASPDLEKVLELSGIELSEASAKDYTYTGILLDIQTTANTTAFLRSGDIDMTVLSIEAGGIEYIRTDIPTEQAQNIRVSEPIPLNITDNTVITIKARIPSLTEQRDIERTYTVTVQFSILFIHLKIYPEGMLP